MVVVPTDTDAQLITNIIAALQNIIATQIGTIGRVYPGIPDTAQETNSVIIPPPIIKVDVEDAGRCELSLTFNIIHGFTRTLLSEAFAIAQSYQMCYLLVFTSIANQYLGGLCRELNTKGSRVIQMKESNTPIVVCATTIEVITDFLVLQS